LHENGHGKSAVQPQLPGVPRSRRAQGQDSALTSAWGAMDFRHWGIRPKLIAVVLIPTIGALVLGGLRMESAVAASASFTRIESLAGILPQADALTDSLQLERDLTIGKLSSTRPNTVPDISSQRATTDADVSALRDALIGVDTSHDKALQSELRDITDAIGNLDSVRQTVDAGGSAASTAPAYYTNIVAELGSLTGQLAAQDSNSEVTRQAVGLTALGQAKEAASQLRGVLYGAALAGALHGTALSDLAGANAALQIGANGYLAQASTADQASYHATVSDAAIAPAVSVVTNVLTTQSVSHLGVTASQWFTDASSEASLLGQVQTKQVASLTRLIHAHAQSARNSALVSAGLIYLILGFALLATLLVARSIMRPLRDLRTAALGVAYRRLPDTVRQLQETDVSQETLEVAPIGISGSDEIGQVARAFDAVHNEAVQLAGQQAMIRGNVSKMFINLSRRSQSLVERQLRLIDDLESSEQDPDQLSNLFRLDHLATRMRRNDESLLVLAGAEGGRRRNAPVPMLDVLRAASAEVEQYSRVKIDAQSSYELTGSAANDVVHLLAELIENATTFSSPTTLVWVRAHTLGASGQMMVEIEDHGIGMSAEELQQANAKLAAPSGMDVSMSRLMGLFVVGRLADRHGIQVQLHTSLYGGLTAFVRLPGDLVVSAAASLVTVQQTREPDLLSEHSPIFDTLQSEWFTRRTPDRLPTMNGTAPARSPANDWQSPADEGWRAAAALDTERRPAAELTVAGLPMRVPGQNLVPGAAVSVNGASSERPATPTTAPPDPRQARSLSSFQQGVHRARSASPNGGRHSEPEPVDDEQRSGPR
jgi:signal transduction histidine kinase